MNTNPITDITFAQIKGNYYWAQYGPFKVIMDHSNGYINATRLCSLAVTKNNTSKEFRKWRETIQSAELINTLSSSARIPADELLVTPTGLFNEIRGTYAHPDLIPHIACWASVDFAIKVSKIVNAHLVRKYKIALKKRKDELAGKDTVIDELRKTMAEIKAQNEEQRVQNTAQSAEIAKLLAEVKAGREDNQNIQIKLDNITDELDAAATVNDKLTTEVHSIAVKLDVATDQRVPPATPRRCNDVFGVYHCPDTSKYRMVRCQKRSYPTCSDRCKIDGYTNQIYYSETPNSVNLGQRLKTVLPAALGTVNGVLVTLARGKTTADLLAYITATEHEKKQV
jgi:hypothetical protein